jgi:hypothetical protein
VYVTPPTEGVETDADSDKSDEEQDGNLNSHGRDLLQSECEVQAAPNDVVASCSWKGNEFGPTTSTDSLILGETSSISKGQLGHSHEAQAFERLASHSSESKTSSKRVAPKRKVGTCKKQNKSKEDRIKQWNTSEPSFTMKVDCDPMPCSDEAMECTSPLDFFLLFFNDNLLEVICDESNRYASQKNVSLDLSKE